MKNISIIISILFFLSATVNAQNIWEKTKEKAKDKVNTRVDNKVDDGMDKGLDKVEDGVEGSIKKDKDGNVIEEEGDASYVSDWKNFNFVPGDDLIFDDKPSIWEENGEFPSRWIVKNGQVEITDFNGENVIKFNDDMPEIIPLMENPSEDYLSDNFTIEFDYFRPAGGNRINIFLYDRKNQKIESNQDISIGYNYISVGSVRGAYPGIVNLNKEEWVHISLSYNSGKLRIFMNEARLINIANYDANPSGFSFLAHFASVNKAYYLKNFRIAQDVEKYDARLNNKGKIVCNGIQFEDGTATLRPESMGPINKIYTLMLKNEDLKFSIEGHTDNYGEDKDNQKISEQRAETVKKTLIDMGISKKRLSTKGYGENKSILENNNPENKAMNCRIEFVKK